jgi:hypothetical protein
MYRNVDELNLPPIEIDSDLSLIKIGTSVKFRAGYKVFSSVNATNTVSASTSVKDYSFVILDNAKSL